MKMCWLEHGQWGLARNPYWGCPGPAALLQASGTQGPSCSHLVASHLQTRCRVAVVPASRDGEGGSVRGRGVTGSRGRCASLPLFFCCPSSEYVAAPE